MKFPLSWLKDHLETTATPHEIAQRLCDIGFEVEDLCDLSQPLAAITVAQVESVSQHPNANKLSVCSINDGSANRLTIVCGASNVRAGMKTALVHVGGFVPRDGSILRAAKIRDIESNGMLCSFDELGLEGKDYTDACEGIVDLENCAPDAVVGAPLAEALGINDTILTVSITPNRGDCLSMRGLARELAAAGIGTMKPLPDRYTQPPKICGTEPFVEVKTITANCPFIYAAVITDVENKPSPKWMQSRLKAAGQRPINAFVDVTNFINFDLGQPMHAYDLDKIVGGITVRQAKDAEKIVALNLQEYELTKDMTVIADDVKPLTIAGIMGGKESGSEADTTRVLLESAYFNSDSIAATGQKLGLTSESRARFERGIDPNCTKLALMYGVHLIQDICGAQIANIMCSEFGNAEYTPPKTVVPFCETKLHSLSGDDTIRFDDAVNILRRLGFKEVEQNSEPTHTCCSDRNTFLEVPAWRHDISITENLIGEVLRIVGYDKIVTHPLFPIIPQENISLAIKIKHLLCKREFNEVYTHPFLSQNEAKIFGGEVEILASCNAERLFLRASLIPQLLKVVSLNQNMNYKHGAMFEIESVFLSADQERLSLCGMRFGFSPRHWLEKSRACDVFDIKSDVMCILDECAAHKTSEESFVIKNIEDISGLADSVRDQRRYYHPGCTGVLMSKCGGDGEFCGIFGELHPQVLQDMDITIPVVAFEILLDSPLFGNANITENKIHEQHNNNVPFVVSTLQLLSRDFCFVLDKTIPASSLMKTIEKVDTTIRSVQIFDVFEGWGIAQGQHSIACQVTIQPIEKPLSETDLTKLSQKIVEAVSEQLGGKLRNV
ncbi:MAG: phenylalanine--tRNA ligase subunit beta [Holosporales bacterium]|jgi:phenylalanyl-tRNA synthetase beta chain|nr:phenylalanine--tRNA ligase subunit beta [Holosporales bacterium]